MKSLIHEWSKKYKTPLQVQRALRQMEYNREKNGETLRSAESALRAGTAHCFEATFIAAAVLEVHGYPPLILSLESQDGLDHVIYLFQQKGKLGTISRSRDAGLHGRAPVFKSLRDLAWSYYDPFIDKTGKVTGFQIAHLDETQSDWRFGTSNVWKAEQYLIDLKHQKLPSSKARYNRVFNRYKKQGPLLSGPHWW